VAALAVTTPVLAADKAQVAAADGLFVKQALAHALVDLAKRTGLSIIFDNRLTRGLSVPRLPWPRASAPTIDDLLDGTGLTYRRLDNQTLVITSAPRPAESKSRASALLPRRAPAPVVPNDVPPADIVVVAMLDGAHQLGSADTLALTTDIIRYSGAARASETLFDLPVFRSSFTAASTALLVSAAGISLADLYGLGPERTMVLVDGRRQLRTIAGNGAISGVDLNLMPRALIKRIEVVDARSSATLGDEAIGGAVNFVTDQELRGLTASAEYGITERGDGEQYALSVAAGTGFADGRGSLVAGISHDQSPGLLAGQRAETAALWGFGADGRASSPEFGTFQPGFGGSGITPEGRVVGIVDSNGRMRRLSPSYTFDKTTGELERFVGAIDQLYNFADDQQLVVPSRRWVGSINAGLDIGDFALSVDYAFARNKVRSQLAPAPLLSSVGQASAVTGDAVVIPIDNPFIPDALRDLVTARFGSDAETLVLERRFVELGPRRRNIVRTQQLAGISFEGPLGAWRQDYRYQYSWGRVDDRASGFVDGARLARALDIDACATDVSCTPINLFAAPRLTPAAAAYVTAAPAHRRIDFDQQLLTAKLRREGNGSAVTAGLEYRRESLDDRPIGDAAPTVRLGDFLSGKARGHFDVAEVFADGNLELASEQPGLHALHATTSARLSHFSSVGTVGNWSIGLRWAPTRRLAFDAGLSGGRRAPQLAELFSVEPARSLSVPDPCSRPSDASIAANCGLSGALGVPPGFQATGELVQERLSGNPDVNAETHLSWSASARFRNDRMSASIAYFDFSIDNAIVSAQAAQVVGACYSSPSLSSPFCGDNPLTGEPFIRRDPATGALVAVDSVVINGGRIDLSGINGRFDARTPVGSSDVASELRFSLLATYLLTARIGLTPEGVQEQLRGTPAYPRFRAYGQAAFERGPLTATLGLEFLGAARSTYELDLKETRIDAALYVDAGMQYRVGEKLTLYGGIRNVTDRKPPVVAFGSLASTFPEHYDPFGRRFYFGIETRFR
jgi:outer membrane receptor for ferrienterochelin and colicin